MWDEMNYPLIVGHITLLLLICWLIDTIVTIVIFNCHCIWLHHRHFFWIKNLEPVPCKVLSTQTQVKVRLLATNQKHLKKRGRKWEENEKEGVNRFIHLVLGSRWPKLIEWTCCQLMWHGTRNEASAVARWCDKARSVEGKRVWEHGALCTVLGSSPQSCGKNQTINDSSSRSSLPLIVQV